MSPLSRLRTANPWKVSTLLLTVALILVVGREIPAAEAAGPARLSKALSALKAGKKFLDDAKDPPAPFHQQSLATVTNAITAVEKEIKAYEAAKDKDKGKDHKADAPKEKAKEPGDKKKTTKKSDAAEEG